MKINTLYFGEIELDEKDILYFEDGLPGFDNMKKFTIINPSGNDSPFRWLQCIENENPAFPIISPFEIKPDYEIDIDETTEENLKISNPNDVMVYSIIVIPSEDMLQMSANLKAPIIINTSNNRAKQMIMDNSPYSVKHYILEEMVKAKAAMAGEEK